MEGANVEIVKSTKGKDKIYVGGCLYVLDKKLSGGGLAYECEKRRSYGDRAGQCHGRLHAKDGKVTDRGLNVLNNADHWFMDGTFKTAPGLFYQL